MELCAGNELGAADAEQQQTVQSCTPAIWHSDLSEEPVEGHTGVIPNADRKGWFARLRTKLNWSRSASSLWKIGINTSTSTVGVVN